MQPGTSLLCLLIAAACAGLAAAASLCDTQGSWTMVWSEDFEGSALNTSRWTVATGPGGSLGRDAWLLDSNVRVEDGNLVLVSHRQPYNGSNFTSGAVVSQNKAFFQYGRVCVRAKLPGSPKANASTGIWPAHWLMPNDNSCWPDHGEIDIMEQIDGVDQVHGTYHWGPKYPLQNCTGTDDEVTNATAMNAWWKNYHEFAVDFSPTHVTFYLNGHAYSNVTSHSRGTPNATAPILPASPFYVLLNTALGGHWPGSVANTTQFPIYHYIDYVRVAQQTGHISFNDEKFLADEEQMMAQLHRRESQWQGKPSSD